MNSVYVDWHNHCVFITLENRARLKAYN